MDRDIALRGIIAVNYLLNLDPQKWLNTYSELALTFDNKCHTLNRDHCYLNQKKDQKLLARYATLQTENLFYNAVPCARKIFGYDDEDGVIDLQDGTTQITSKDQKYKYLRYTATETQLHSFTITSDSNFELAYDFINCNGRTKAKERPNKDDGNCQFIENSTNINFADFDSTGPVYIGIKFIGNATVKVEATKVITLTEEGGAAKSLYTNNYQPYKYQADDIGYVVIKTITKMTSNAIQLYHNTEDCRRDKTIYPRQSHYCMKSNGKGSTGLVIKNESGNGQLHYFGVQIGNLDRVEFNYDFIHITEVIVDKPGGMYEFDDTLAVPFQVKLGKGSYNISALSNNKYICNIYVDYEGCTYGFSKLPGKGKYCLMSTYDQKEAECKVSFNLEEDSVIYFGIDSLVKQSMDFRVFTNRAKLEFLE
jgi:hypothetical protein